MQHLYEVEKQTAIDAVKEAAELCKNVQQQITTDVLRKKDRSPVTVADYGSQALICRRLQERFPNDLVIAEENSSALQSQENKNIMDQVMHYVHRYVQDADAQKICNWIDHGNMQKFSERFWTLDPIDGTKGFLRGEQYAVSLALIIKGRVEVSALACPNLPPFLNQRKDVGTIFFAMRGFGSYMIPIEQYNSTEVPIEVTQQAVPHLARFCESVESGHSSHRHSVSVAEYLGIKNQPVRLDSQAKYAVVARGEADIYLRLPTKKDYREKIWDHAGGWLIVTEAGGNVTDMNGKAIEFTHGTSLDKNEGIIVTNGLLHDRVLEAIQHLDIS